VRDVVACLLFFVLHWQGSLFFQSFFLHRYGAHRQFTMSRGWERVFHFLTWVTQGSSYIAPRAYAILHRMHHAYADTVRDPHAPVNHPSVLPMMWQTAKVYNGLRGRTVRAEPRFEGGYPEWKLFDETLYGWVPSLGFAGLYTLFYLHFATTPWLFLLLPIHYAMGPVHGAIVNWCGHRYGYRNFATVDASKNTMPIDFLTGGELLQNNHHRSCQSPNFAARWFEIDSTWQVMRVLAALRIIDVQGAPRLARLWRRPANRRLGRAMLRVVPPGGFDEGG
jgi:stearoyl-CoA desaturase (delta-9 desaturase)